jgi:hypothetical protein
VKATERRLAPVLAGHKPDVVSVSASRALQETDIDECDKCSIVPLRLRLEKIAHSLERQSTRELRLLHRARLCLLKCASDVEQTLALAEKDITELEEELAAVDTILSRKEERMKQLDNWIEDRRLEILAIVSKSLRCFQDGLSDAITEWVEDYKATDFKEFVEEKIPSRVRKHCKIWIETYTGPINRLLMQLDVKIASALGREFEEYVPRLRVDRACTFDEIDNIYLSTTDISTTSQRAGLYAGGAAAAMVLLHASAFIPVIGLAAFPYLMKTMTEKELKMAKDKLRPEMQSSLEKALATFAQRIIVSVSNDIDTLRIAAEERFQVLMLELRENIAKNFADRVDNSNKSQKMIFEIKTALADYSKESSSILNALERLNDK